MKKSIIYTYPAEVSFIKKDQRLLSTHFDTIPFLFQPKYKVLTPISFLKQFFFLCKHVRNISAYVTQFAGYHSLLPALFGKLFNKPSLLILAGTDCVSFPSIRYGNFQKTFLGLFTKWSILLSEHLTPVHKSLVFCEFSYTEDDYPNQGYLFFVPNAKKVTWTEIYYGYNAANLKRKNVLKQYNSFLTVTQSVKKPSYYRKGIDLILGVASKFPFYIFTIVGVDEMPHDVIIPGNVKLFPPIPYEDLMEMYSSHEFYFQLSINEGFPNALCEAMLCECIPIVSNVAAMPFIVSDTGFILMQKDIDQLKSIISKATQSNKSDLARKARARIVTNFTEELRETSLKNLLLDLIHDKGQ